MVGRPELLARFEQLSGLDWEALEGRFPISVPRAFLDAAEGPGREAVLRQALPDPRELVSDAGDVPDPVGEQRLSPLPWVVRKHKDRVLLLLTKLF